MLIPFRYLVQKYCQKKPITGVISIGAHFGEEFQQFRDAGILWIMMIEPDPKSFIVLQNKFENDPQVLLYNLACGSKNEHLSLHVSSNTGQSSSLLKPKKHKDLYPNITFNYKEKVVVTPLDHLFDVGEYAYYNTMIKHIIHRKMYNMISIDVQGYELEVFKGAEETLKNIDYILSEVNNSELYENCVQISELDKFLGEHGFKRVETHWECDDWGDAFYVRKTLL